MEPATMAMIAQSIGSILGGNNARNTANQAAANQAALVQAQMNEGAANRALMSYFSNRAYNDSKLGTTDAQGNRTYFQDGVGQVTQLSPMAQALLNATQQEQLQQLTQDAPMYRDQLQRNQVRQREEGTTADAILAQFRQGPEYTRDGLESLFRDRMMRDTNEGFDTAQSNLNRQSLRTGADVSKSLAKLIGERAKAQREAGTDAKLQAIGAWDSMEGNRANRFGSLYNTMASRASGMPQTQYTPYNTNGIDNQAANSARNTAALSTGFTPQNSLQGISMPGPNYADSIFMQGAGQVGGQLFDVFSGRQKGNSSTGLSTQPKPDNFWSQINNSAF